jgi:hypothetical protein
MKGTRPLKIALHDVIKVLDLISKRKCMTKFKAAARKNNAVMLVEPATVNFVKDFMASNAMHNHPIGKHVINPRVAAPAARAMRGAAPGGGSPDFECDFSKH